MYAVRGRTIVASHPFAARVHVEPDGEEVLFPNGARLRADMRDYVGAPEILVALTSENGGLTVIDENTFEIQLTGEQTARMTQSYVVVDLIRTDVSPPIYSYVELRIPVKQPVTRGI